MQVTVDISLYPNNQDYLTPIDAFIAALNTYDDIKVITFPTATVVQGDYDRVFEILQKEIRAHREQHGMGVFVTKIIPGYEAL